MGSIPTVSSTGHCCWEQRVVSKTTVSGVRFSGGPLRPSMPEAGEDYPQLMAGGWWRYRARTRSG